MVKKEDLSQNSDNLTNSVDDAYNSLQNQREQKAHESPDAIDIFDNYSNDSDNQDQQSIGNSDWVDRSKDTDEDSDQSAEGEETEGEETEGEEAEEEAEEEAAEEEGVAEGEEAAGEEAAEEEGVAEGEEAAEGEGAAAKQAGATAAKTEVADAAAEGTAEALEGGAVDAVAEGAAEALGPEAAAALAAADYVTKKTTGKSIPQLLLYTILGFVLSGLGLILAVAFGLGLMNTDSAIADPTTATGEYFPVPDYSGCIPNINNSSCDSRSSYFKALRSGGSRYHVGIDLVKNYSSSGEVVAVKDGTVTILMVDWFQSTDALIVNHGDYSINYGEIEVDPSVRSAGTEVKAGQKLGKMQTNNAGNAMLHFELYDPGVTRSYQWYVGNSQPDELRDPTKFLEDLLEAKNAGT